MVQLAAEVQHKSRQVFSFLRIGNNLVPTDPIHCRSADRHQALDTIWKPVMNSSHTFKRFRYDSALMSRFVMYINISFFLMLKLIFFLGIGRFWRETAGDSWQGAEPAEGGNQPSQRASQLNEPSGGSRYSFLKQANGGWGGAKSVRLGSRYLPTYHTVLIKTK